MKSIFTVIIILGSLLTLNAQAQVKLGEIPVAKSFNQQHFQGTFHPHDSTFAITFIEVPNRVFQIMDYNLEIISRAAIPAIGLDNCLGSTHQEDSYSFYFMGATSEGPAVKIYSLDKGGKTMNATLKKVEMGYATQFLGTLISPEAFYTFVLNRKEEQIRVQRLTNGEDMEVKTFALSDEDTKKLKNLTFTGMRASDQDVMLEEATPLEKIYAYHDKIYLTLNYTSKKERGQTDVITLDWATGETNSQSFAMEPASNNIGNNSYLLNNYLFQLTLEPRQLHLKVTDIAGEKELASYSYGENERIAIASGDVHQRGNIPDSRKGDLYSGRDETLRSISTGRTAVAVNYVTPTEVELQIGAVKREEYTTGGTLLVRPGTMQGVGSNHNHSSMLDTGEALEYNQFNLTSYIKSYIALPSGAPSKRMSHYLLDEEVASFVSFKNSVGYEYEKLLVMQQDNNAIFAVLDKRNSTIIMFRK